MTFAEACDRVLRFCRVMNRRDVLIHSSKEFDTHWFITYGVPSLEYRARIFQYVTIIVEKQTGDVYYAPSRSRHPIDFADFPANRQQFTRVTIQDMDDLEKEASDRLDSTDDST